MGCQSVEGAHDTVNRLQHPRAWGRRLLVQLAPIEHQGFSQLAKSPLPIAQPDARAAAIFGDELDAG